MDLSIKAKELGIHAGFIDAQVNGGGDVLFNDQTSVEAMTACTRMTPPCDSAHACTSRASTAELLPASHRGFRSSRRSRPTGPPTKAGCI